MERRKEHRLKTNRQVTLTVLGISGGSVMEGCLLDVSGSGIRLRTPLPIPCGASIKVDASDLLLLGEVCRCAPEQDAYIVGMQLCHALGALAELEKVNRALLGDEFFRQPDRARSRK